MKTLLESEVDALISARIYSSKEELLADAVRALFQVEPRLKIESAVELYRREEVSISKAAEIAGMSLEDFKNILARKGIRRVIKAPSKEEMEKEACFRDTLTVCRRCEGILSFTSPEIEGKDSLNPQKV